jgi:hypothetical protein
MSSGNPNLIPRRRSARPALMRPTPERIAARPDVLPVQVPPLNTVRIPEGMKIPIRAADAAAMMAKHTPLGDLMDGLARYAMDPLGFVLWAFPWGEPGTSLADMDGPEEWQRKQLERIGHKLREGGEDGAVIEEDVSAGHGVGKANDVNMVFNTPAGETRWGDLMPGDVVFGADGAPTRVVQTRHYENVPMYRVALDDGSHCDVSSGHLWNVRGRQERRKGLDTWRTLETAEILDLGVKRSNGTAMARQWELPVQGAAQFEEREIDLHPYLVGVWLGDGSRGNPAWGKPHLEVKAKVESCGYEVHTTADGTTQRVQNATHLFTDPVFQCYSYERYIPDDYKFNTVANRVALFEGLMDTDGEVNHTGSIGYSTTSRRLADDVIWLARSLGCKAQLQPTTKLAWYPEPLSGARVECRDCYRITINAPFNPFTIEHRRKAYKPSEARYLKRWIDSIEPLPNAPHAMCITVEAPDGLYQANDFIVTHNSALVSWQVLWAISTHADTRGVVTANTDTQLRTKTWAELAKWYAIFIGRQLFKLTATAIYIADDPVREKAWRIDQVPWSETNTEAFAGMHNQGKRVLVIFDEASSIHDKVWEVTEGALTDAKTQIIWLRYGNPTKTTGEFFRRCTQAKRNHYTRVDSRSVRFTNKKQIQAWVDDYGEDSDFVRVRVKGEFPRAGYSNFISPGIVTEARARGRNRAVHLNEYAVYPKIIAVDPARFGDDSTVITLRQGRKVHFQLELKGFDGFDIASRVEQIVKDEGRPHCIAYDAIGNGAELDGVLKRAPWARGITLIPVMWGQPAKDDKQYFNQRSECWGHMRDWLAHGAIPDDDELATQLSSLDYGYDAKMRIQLQSKKDAKKEGKPSPDKGDSLAISFAPDLIDMKVRVAKVRPQQRRLVIMTRTG